MTPKCKAYESGEKKIDMLKQLAIKSNRTKSLMGGGDSHKHEHNFIDNSTQTLTLISVSRLSSLSFAHSTPTLATEIQTHTYS